MLSSLTFCSGWMSSLTFFCSGWSVCSSARARSSEAAVHWSKLGDNCWGTRNICITFQWETSRRRICCVACCAMLNRVQTRHHSAFVRYNNLHATVRSARARCDLSVNKATRDVRKLFTSLNMARRGVGGRGGRKGVGAAEKGYSPGIYSASRAALRMPTKRRTWRKSHRCKLLQNQTVGAKVSRRAMAPRRTCCRGVQAQCG
jgi:hypothetical protein